MEEKLIYPIEVSEFRKCVKVFFENINDGFERFDYNVIENKTEDQWIDFFNTAHDEEGFNNFYIDLHLNNINDSNEQAFLSMLLEADREIYFKLKQQYDKSTIHYKINKSIIPFLTRLNTREVLFVTIFLTKSNRTIWGNYDLKFPIFTEKMI